MARVSVLKLLIALLTLFLATCGGQVPFEPGASLVAEATPTVTIQSRRSPAEEVQLIQLDNCDGKADLKRTEERSQWVDVEISAELAAQIGASAEVIYGNVQAAVGAAITSGNARVTMIELSAPPGTKMEFQLIWTGDEEIGVVQKILNSDIPIAFRSFSATDVRIKSQYDLSCPATPAGSAQDNTGAEAESQEPAAIGGSVGSQDTLEEASVPQPIAAPTVVTQPLAPFLVGTVERFEVQANVWKNSTGIVVAPGDTIRVQYLEGQWTGDSNQPGLTEGCGFRYDDPVAEHVWAFPPEQRGAALVGYIDGSSFFIGCHPLDFVAPVGGEIYLGMSECDGCYWDNSGQLYVRVEVTRP